jgi:hypothetical protein
MVNPQGPVNPQLVRNFHNHDDVDSSIQAHHHTLGVGATQAYPGTRGKRLESLVEEYNEALELRLDTAEADIDAITPMVPSLGSNGDIVALGVTTIAGWSFGSNFITASGYLRQVYFNLVPAAQVNSSATGDIGNIEITNVRFPVDHRPVIRAALSPNVNGPAGTNVSLGEGGDITLSALLPNINWSAGAGRSFSGLYLSSTYIEA